MNKKVDARALIAKLSRESEALREREILAPLLPGGKIRTRLNGLVYNFKPLRNFVGWGNFRPVNEQQAEPLGEAAPWQRGAYLELFPALRLLLLWPLADKQSAQAGVWMALPYNAGDAKQRFGFSSNEPVPVYLCDTLAGASQFERIVARVDGGLLWFDTVDALANPEHADWLREAFGQPQLPEKYLPGLAGSERLALLFAQIHRLEQEEHAREQEALRQLATQTRRERQRSLVELRSRNRLESDLRHALAKADATLHSFTQAGDTDGSPGHLVVEWSENGQTYRYRSVIQPSLDVVSSGICLSDRDDDFDLTSLVSVMVHQDDDDYR